MHLYRILIVSVSAILAGCATTAPIVSSESLTVTSDLELPAPTRADGMLVERTATIGPFDKLSVKVVGMADLSLEEVQVDPAGRIAVPLAGVLVAAGQTPQELSSTIAARLRAAFVRAPQVAVNIRETVSHTFTVDGSVVEPGLYPVIGNMTLMKSVATAKGLTEFAKLDDVIVFRTSNGNRMAALYNLSAIRRGAYGDPKIYADDVIIVGDSPARRLFRDFVALSPLLAGPIIAVLQRR